MATMKCLQRWNPALKSIRGLENQHQNRDRQLEGVISWQQLLAIGNNASDGNLRSRLANIAINQVVMWVMMVRGDISPQL